MRLRIALAAALLAAPLHAQQVPADTARADSAAVADSVWVIDQQRVDAYLGDLVSVGGAAWFVALGLYDHVRTEPDEWGGGADALTKRIASRAGGHVVGTSVRHGLAAALGRTTEYRRCAACAGPEHRIAYAITETFTDYDEQGRPRLSTPFLAGTYAGALAPVLWHPDADAAEALQSGTLSLLWAVANNIVTELWGTP